MKYFFQFGRNKELALYELQSVLQSNKYEFKLHILDSKNCIVELSDTIDLRILISVLAGTIKFGKILYETPKIDSSLFDHIDFYYPKNFNLFYSYDNPEQNDFDSIFHTFIKTNKLRGQLKFIQNDPLKAENYIAKTDENIEIVIIQYNNTYLISKIDSFIDSNQFKLLDNERPSRRITHGTSFRLARMMVNILSPKKDSWIVDPFCGTGTFLIEVLKKNANAIGIDTNEKLISMARENLKWAKEKFDFSNDFKLLCTSSENADFKADGVVFEPYMGPFLKEIPKQKQAKKIISELHGLYFKILKNIYANTIDSVKIVCIIPYFNTQEKNVLEIPSDLFNQSGFKIYETKEVFPKFPIEYHASDGSLIGRRIYLLEKLNVKRN